MNLLQYPEAMNASDIQIWNNAAFDNGDLQDMTTFSDSWSPVKPIFVNPSKESLDSAASKENRSPVNVKSPVSTKSPKTIKPLYPNNIIKCSEKNQVKSVSKLGLSENVVWKNGNDEEVANERKIHQEIEEIEKEINRLTSRLKVLRLDMAEKNVKTVDRLGQDVPANCMDQKLSVKKAEGKKTEEISSFRAGSKFQRRSHSLGPIDLVAGTRRGLSLGQSEIISGIKSGQPGKQETVHVRPIQNMRKSCFWKLQDIDEKEKGGTKEREKCSTVSPKPRKTLGRARTPRQSATTTVGLKKAVKKEDGFVSSIQPKKLFKDAEKSVPVKKPIKQGQIVASRYNQSPGSAAPRKRSLPENEKDESKMTYDKKRSLSVGKSREAVYELNQSRGTESHVRKRWEIPSIGTESHMRKRWEIPREIAIYSPPLSFFSRRSEHLGSPAKRAPELIRRNLYFSIEEEGGEHSFVKP